MLSESCILIKADNYHLLSKQSSYTYIQNIEELRPRGGDSGLIKMST